MAQGLGSNSQPQGRELKEMGICLSFAWCWSNDVENEAKKKAAEEPKSKRPSNTQWGQQTLPACKPVRTKLTASVSSERIGFCSHRVFPLTGRWLSPDRRVDMCTFGNSVSLLWAKCELLDFEPCTRLDSSDSLQASEISVRYDNICPNQLPGASNSARLQWQWNVRPSRPV
jgi:hypothetical protein